MENPVSKQRANVLIGLALVGLGVLFLAGQTFNFRIWDISWPLYVIVPGLVFILIGVAVGKNGLPITTFGTITTVTGLILWYQNDSNNWQTWAYAWALIFPTSIGIAMAIQGFWTSQGELVQRGLRTAGVGLVLFLVCFSFFEATINLSGFESSLIAKLAGPVVLIGLGVAMLLRNDNRPFASREK